MYINFVNSKVTAMEQDMKYIYQRTAAFPLRLNICT